MALEDFNVQGVATSWASPSFRVAGFEDEDDDEDEYEAPCEQPC